jgi:ligand-binding sensor domain-containing protein
MRESASVCKDNKGFIWTSSKTGVLRLAGDDYHIYQLPYENADIISVTLVYTKSCLLAYTNNGQLFRYNAIDDKFELLVSLTKVLKNKYLSVNNMLVDNSGHYWIATSFGLFRYQTGHLTFFRNSDEIDRIAWHSPNCLFVARPDGIWLLDKQTLKKKCLYRYSRRFDFHVSKFYYDNNTKRLWIGTQSNGLFYYDLTSHRISSVQTNAIPKQPVLAIAANSESTILIGIDGQGLWELNKQGTKILNVYKEDANNPSSLRGNGVYDIFNDQNKRIWVCTYSGAFLLLIKLHP